MPRRSPPIVPIAILSTLILLCSASYTYAEDIDGVQPAAMDQPRINVVVRRQAKGPVLSGRMLGQELFNVESFLDTGASGVLLSSGTAERLGVKRQTTTGAAGTEVRFEDVGVGGGSSFAVSEPIFLSMAPYTPAIDVEHRENVDGVYTLTSGPLRAQVGPLGGAGDLVSALALGDLDVAGMPVLVGKIVVMDTRDVNKFEDKIRTRVYDAKSRDPSIPRTRRHVKLSYASFKRFTTTTPPAAEGPALAENPFIGPSPLKRDGDPTPPIVVAHNGKASSGSWLLDTGAAASMISRKQAGALGVRYVPLTDGTDQPQLSGVAANNQFTLSVGGIGGTKKAAGFYLDRLSLGTREGQPLNFLHAPVLVVDITVKDQASGQSLTLDGVFGMNFLVASAKIDQAGLMPDITKLTPGAFRWIVFDQPAGMLGLD